ncbi:hypothetical protein CCM_01015 [Cordyceps militaris CM01]|uniref:Uncharacterized protein n=1 Tax=Cordyceps militaris (strain CM01) TaxID=983644 RepID=G3J7U5_CORMM|nr:uncharacterized protein CCM_01015 [Cordyceps militaris CM01]EGX96359.1 hypothetical protein CCM_01015 [Cordyceps militaris CM01]
MSTSAAGSSIAPGAQFEHRQNFSSSDFTPNPSVSLQLSPTRQGLVDDILALYDCRPTIARIERYTPDAVYDDQFGYADNRYKIAAQWFGLAKMVSVGNGSGAYQVVRDEPALIQLKSCHKWTLPVMPKTVTICSMISLSLEPETAESSFVRIKYHKDQANEQDFTHAGIGFNLKQWQADQLPKYLNDDELKHFEADKRVTPQKPMQP